MTLTEQAVERLRDALMRRELGQGGTVTERLASEFLNMSRTPVRAALQTLANEGLLTYESQKGYRTHEVSRQSVADTYKVRAALEALACRQMDERRPSRQILEELTACIAEGRRLLSHRATFDMDIWRAMNVRFHQAIVSGAENETLLAAMQQVVNRPFGSASTIARIGANPRFDLLELAQFDHEMVTRYIMAGQTERAAARLHEHIMVSHDLIVQDLD